MQAATIISKVQYKSSSGSEVVYMVVFVVSTVLTHVVLYLSPNVMKICENGE